MLCGIVLLWAPVFSPWFYALYVAAGVTDMLDGFVARKTGTASTFGAKLDTAADMVFVIACMVRLLPELAVSAWLWIWIGVIAAAKLAVLLIGAVRRGEFAVLHTRLDKLTGAVLFILPLTLSAVPLSYSASTVCVLATAAVVQELYLVSK